MPPRVYGATRIKLEISPVVGRAALGRSGMCAVQGVEDAGGIERWKNNIAELSVAYTKGFVVEFLIGKLNSSTLFAGRMMD